MYAYFLLKKIINPVKKKKKQFKIIFSSFPAAEKTELCIAFLRVLKIVYNFTTFSHNAKLPLGKAYNKT